MLAVAGLIQCCSPVAQAESVYSANQDSAAFFFNLGKEDQTAHRYNSAWRYFEQAARYDSRDAETQLAIADVCLQMNKMAPAIKALETAGRLRSTDYSVQWKLVQLYFNYGQYNKVIEILPGLHSHMEETPGWAFMLGKSYHGIPTPNYGKAMQYLEISLKEDSTNGEAAYLIGRMYVQMDNYKAAIPYYQRALSLDATSQPARTYELALVLATAGQFDASIRMFQKAIERGYKPRDDFYMNMAYTMADAHKTEEAIDMMKEMLHRRPQDLGLLNGLADVCYHSGRYKEAIACWNKVLGIDERNARVLYQIGTAYIKMGNDKDGQQLCNQAIGMDPSLGVLKHARQISY